MTPAVEPFTAVDPFAQTGNEAPGSFNTSGNDPHVTLGGTAVIAAAILVGVTMALVWAYLSVRAGPTGMPTYASDVTDHDAAVKAHEELGDVFLARGFSGNPCVFVRGPHAPEVLSSMGFADGKWSGAGAFVVPSNLVQPMAVPTFFHDAGAAWKAARAAVRRVFAPGEAKTDATVRSAERAIGVSIASAGPRGVDAQEFAHAALRDTMLLLGAGTSAVERPEAERAFEHLEAASSAWRADRKLDPARGITDDVAEAAGRAMEACTTMTRAAVTSGSAGGDARSGASLASLLHASLTKAGAPGPAAEAEAARSLFNLVVAGAESNAISTAKTLAAIAADPALVARLQDEVDAAVEAAGGALSAAAVRPAAVPLLAACVKEGLRLFAPATAAQRVADKDTRIGAALVPAGTQVCVCIKAVHLDPSVWPDPLRFDPSRFLGDATKPAKHAFLPFSAGPRRCPGEAVAMMQARTILAVVLRSFTPASGGVPSEHATGFTEWAPRGVPVRLEPRSA